MSIIISLTKDKVGDLELMGLTSQFFHDIYARGVKPQVHLFLKTSVFKVPHTLMVMIGPGTGVAPFIGFIQERTNQIMHLYYGCRREEDFIYKNEMLAAQKNGVELNVAYSKDKGQYV